MLTWYKQQVEAKTSITNLTWFYFYLYISRFQFVFQNVLCSFVLNSSYFTIDLLSNSLLQTFDYF